jgi:hypothetical protein
MFGIIPGRLLFRVQLQSLLSFREPLVINVGPDTASTVFSDSIKHQVSIFDVCDSRDPVTLPEKVII